MAISWKRLMIGTHPRRTLVRAAVVGSLLFVIGRFAFTPCIIDGYSMEPTYRDRGVNIINRLKFRSRPPQRGDVVVIPALEQRKTYYLKRVLGLPGEQISFDHGQLLINGEATAEPWLSSQGNWQVKPMLLGVREYFVGGDNRAIAWDYHVGGAVLQEYIAGGVVF